MIKKEAAADRIKEEARVVKEQAMVARLRKALRYRSKEPGPFTLTRLGGYEGCTSELNGTYAVIQGFGHQSRRDAQVEGFTEYNKALFGCRTSNMIFSVSSVDLENPRMVFTEDCMIEVFVRHDPG